MASKGYGQFCPVAKAAEIVAERWTPLVLRELMYGSRRFSDLRRGVPLMSPSLLSKRLKELEHHGLVEHEGEGGASSYALTEAGLALQPVIQMLGLWGHRWARSRIGDDDLDAGLLMWDVRRRIDPARLPDARVVILFELLDAPANKRRWWLVIEGGEVDLCLKPPGYDVDLTVTSTVRAMVDVWLLYTPLAAALRAGDIRVTGSRALARTMPDWFRLSTFADLPRAEAARA